jgi:hypothetical protein
MEGAKELKSGGAMEGRMVRRPTPEIRPPDSVTKAMIALPLGTVVPESIRKLQGTSK